MNYINDLQDTDIEVRKINDLDNTEHKEYSIGDYYGGE